LPVNPHTIRIISELYADLRKWKTKTELIPPAKESPAGTIEKITGSTGIRSSIVHVRLQNRWYDTEKYFKLEHALHDNHRIALIHARTTPRSGPGALPMTIGDIITSSMTNEHFADLWEALETIEHELTTLKFSNELEMNTLSR
jgi:hypothetical protein